MSYQYQQRDDDFAIMTPGTQTTTPVALLAINRPIAGYVECWCRDAVGIFDYSRTFTGGTWIDRRVCSSSSSVLFRTVPGSVRIDVRAGAGSASFTPNEGWADGAAATPRVMARWTPFRPLMEAIEIVAIGAAATDFGPARIAAAGTQDYKPPRFARRAVVRTNGPATVTVTSGAPMSIVAVNGGPVTVDVGPISTLTITNTGTANLLTSVMWLPPAGGV